MTLQADALRRTAFILVIAGLAWNLVEAGVSLWAGAQAGSVALLAFGLDSIVELFAGGVLLWRLRGEREGHEEEHAEMRAQKLLGLSFFLLALYIALHSVANLVGWLPEPQVSPVGVGIVVASAVVMSGLYVGKMRIANPDAVPVFESGGHGNAVLRHPGSDHPGGSGVERLVFLVVG